MRCRGGAGVAAILGVDCVPGAAAGLCAAARCCAPDEPLPGAAWADPGPAVGTVVDGEVLLGDGEPVGGVLVGGLDDGGGVGEDEAGGDGLEDCGGLALTDVIGGGELVGQLADVGAGELFAGRLDPGLT